MTSPSPTPNNLDLVLDIPVKLSVELGGCQLPMREVLQLTPGSIVQLENAPDSAVAVYVNNRLIARGEVVAMDDCLGIRITEMMGGQA